MSSPVHDVPKALVLVPLLVVSLAVMLWRLRSGGRFTWPPMIVGAAACGYGVGVLKEVLQPSRSGSMGAITWAGGSSCTSPRWSARSRGDLLDNVVLFLPLRVLLVLRARVRSVPRVTLIGFVLSLMIETI